MDEHVHEWEPSPDEWGGYYCNTRNIEGKYCTEILSAKEVSCRLNATERLSAEDAMRFANLIDGEYSVGETVVQELYDYANTLEGK